jgi:hypothetical protein
MSDTIRVFVSEYSKKQTSKMDEVRKIMSTDPYIRKKEAELEKILTEQKKIMIKKGKILKELESVNKDLELVFWKYHNIRELIELYQETGKKR